MSSPAEETAAPPQALNLAPTKKTEMDLFARAPQVKKMSRKDKHRLALAAAMGDAAAKKRQQGGAAKSADADLFSTVFADELGEEGDADGQEQAKSRQSGRKKSKKQILRHALHKNEEEDVRTVFVGNLPNTIDKKHVAKVFKDCGTVESVRVRSQALEAAGGAAVSGEQQQPGGETTGASSTTTSHHHQQQQQTVGKKDVGRAVRVLRGEIKKDPKYSATAYVLFKDASSVAVAIEKKNGVVFQNRHLVVTALDASSVAYPPDTSIFLGNVAYNTTEEDIWAFFTERGIRDVKRVRLVRDRDSGDCKGFGYVEFNSKASVEPAIATRGAPLNGRELRIVHVNKSKDVKAVTASRREKRARTGTAPPKEDGKRGSRHQDGPQKRQRREASGDARGKERREASGGGGGQPSWMGMTTNPRKKVPRDLRSLSENNGDRKFKGPRAPVKRKMRNPEK